MNKRLEERGLVTLRAIRESAARAVSHKHGLETNPHEAGTVANRMWRIAYEEAQRDADAE